MHLRLLLIEDSEDDALLLVLELRKGGFDPDFARVETPQELEAALNGNNWDAVICDHNMPAFTGIDALRIIQAKGLDIPFILVSGVIGDELAVDALNAGAHDYIRKGNFSRLAPSLERELRNADVRRERQQAVEELQRSHDELETRVRQGTTELVQVNQALRAEIAGHKHMEVELRESWQRLTDIIQFYPDATMVVDIGGKVIAWNRSMEELTGVRAEEMLGRGDYEYALPFYGERRPILVDLVTKLDEEIEKKYPQFKRQGDKIVGEAYFRNMRGEKIYFHGTATPLRNSTGEVIGAIESLRDISEKKQMEDELQKSKDTADVYAQRLELALEGSNDATWEWELITNQCILNTRYYEMSGYPPGEVNTDFAFFMKSIHPDDVSEVEKRVTEHLEGKIDKYEAKYRMVSRSGQIKHVIGRGKVVRRDDNGMPLKMAGVVSDITEQKRLDDEVSRIHNLESIGLLAGGLAHDFNNLLNIIYGNITFAKMHAEGNTAVAEPLNDAEEACERAREFGIRLQAFAQGSFMVMEQIALPALIADAAETLFKGTNISHTIATADDILPIEADPRQIRQVFENLLTNAKEAMSAGGSVRIAIENRGVDDNMGLPLGSGRYVCIAILDDGMGIPVENLPKIFNPYFSTKDTYSQRGMGLGLPICHAILKKHGGHICVESQLGVGTRVTVYLPASVDETKLSAEESQGVNP